jgi:hypothetical protein
MKKNKIVLALALGLLIIPAFITHAEDATVTTTNVKPDIKNIRDGFKNDVKKIREDAKQKAGTIKKNFKNEKKNIIDSTKQERDVIKQDIQKKIKEIQDSTTLTIAEKATQIKTLRNEKAKNVKAEIEQKKTEMKASIEKRTTELKANIDAKKAEITKQIANKKDEIKKKLDTKAQEKVKTNLDKIYTNLSGKITKLSEIDAKILVKINADKTAGVDTTKALAQYTIAKTALDKAITNVSATKTISIDQTSIQTSKETLRALVKTAEDSIKNAGVEYRKIVPLTTQNKVETTTTPVTTN